MTLSFGSGATAITRTATSWPFWRAALGVGIHSHDISLSGIITSAPAPSEGSWTSTNAPNSWREATLPLMTSPGATREASLVLSAAFSLQISLLSGTITCVTLRVISWPHNDWKPVGDDLVSVIPSSNLAFSSLLLSRSVYGTKADSLPS